MRTILAISIAAVVALSAFISAHAGDGWRHYTSRDDFTDAVLHVAHSSVVKGALYEWAELVVGCWSDWNDRSPLVALGLGNNGLDGDGDSVVIDLRFDDGPVEQWTFHRTDVGRLERHWVIWSGYDVFIDKVRDANRVRFRLYYWRSNIRRAVTVDISLNNSGVAIDEMLRHCHNNIRG